MKQILTFGELLIRLQSTSRAFIKHDKSNAINAFAGGSEANVSVALAQLGIPVSYFTAVPDNAITQEIIDLLQHNNVDTSKILWQGDRIGTYILLSANGLTEGSVIYDRKYSSFSQLHPGDINLDTLFEGCSWLHFTALTPALSLEMAHLIEAVLNEAVKRNLTISIDLNYRNKLWQYGKSPLEVMPQLVQHCDVIMGNIWAENKMLGTSIDASLNRDTNQEIYIKYANNVATEIFTKYPKCRHIANTFRFMDNATHNLLYGTYHTPDGNWVSETLETNSVIDRIGSGDAFMGGLIYGIYNSLQPQQIVDVATKTGFEKLFVAGDFTNTKQ